MCLRRRLPRESEAEGAPWNKKKHGLSKASARQGKTIFWSDSRDFPLGAHLEVDYAAEHDGAEWVPVGNGDVGRHLEPAESKQGNLASTDTQPC
jgi:hypothetical protein